MEKMLKARKSKQNAALLDTALIPVVLQPQKHPGAFQNGAVALLDVGNAIACKSVLHDHLLCKISEQVAHNLGAEAVRFASKAASARYSTYFSPKRLAVTTLDRQHAWMRGFVADGPAQDTHRSQLLVYEMEALVDSELEVEEELLYNPQHSTPDEWVGSVEGTTPALIVPTSAHALLLSSSSSLSAAAPANKRASRRKAALSKQQGGGARLKIALPHNIPPTNVTKLIGSTADLDFAPTRLHLL